MSDETQDQTQDQKDYDKLEKEAGKDIGDTPDPATAPHAETPETLPNGGEGTVHDPNVEIGGAQTAAQQEAEKQAAKSE